MSDEKILWILVITGICLIVINSILKIINLNYKLIICINCVISFIIYQYISKSIKK